MRKLKRIKNHGATTMELAMLFPLIFAFGLGIVQFIIFLQSSTATQYAAFAAARSFQVYGDRPLKDVRYPRTDLFPNTHPEQTIAEAVAERAIFEMLLWEHKRIKTHGGSFNSLDRFYEDGDDASYDGIAQDPSKGAVHINFLGCQGSGRCAPPLAQGVEITYCMPIVFPGISYLFAQLKKDYPCNHSRFGREYSGIAITKKAQFGREPVEL